MSAEKKYFWLKLKENFFDDKQIKYLRSLPDGDKIVITYLKMQLKSLKTMGSIRYDKILPSCEEELALMLDEDINIVKFTLNALLQINAIEILEDNTIFMLAMQELIGKESASAERVRKFRANQKLALQSNTPETNCNTDIDIEVDKEIKEEIEKEKNVEAELEVKKEDIFLICKSKGIELSTNAEDFIIDCLKKGMTKEIILYAIAEAVDHQIKNWCYVQKILNRYIFEGYRTIDEVKKDTATRERESQPMYNKKFYDKFYAN